MDPLAKRIATRFAQTQVTAGDPRSELSNASAKILSVTRSLQGRAHDVDREAKEALQAADELYKLVSSLIQGGKIVVDKTAAQDPRWKVAEGDLNLPKLERIVSSLEHEVKEMRSALEKYKSDPGKNKPQLKNLAHGASIAGSDLRVLLRTLGEE